MGFDRATIHFLLNAKKQGISLDRVLMIGRQTLYVTAPELHALLIVNGVPATQAHAERLVKQNQGYAEPLLKYLGAGQIESIDISTYERASIVHDMNLPLPERYHSQFDLVIDGGSLEHVFHYPVAIQNCMEAVARSGHLLTVTPANNLLGHGFYQISPELLFRVLSPENGYSIARMMIYEQPWTGTWYAVADPEKVRSRVELTNSKPAYLLTCARRIEIVPIFSKTPQQSDYSKIWKESAEREPPPTAPPWSWKQRVPTWMVRLYWKMRPFRPAYYRKMPARFPD